MPRYERRTDVWALHIKDIDTSEPGKVKLIPSEDGFAPIVFSVSKYYSSVNIVNQNVPINTTVLVTHPGGRQHLMTQSGFEDTYQRKLD